MSIYLSFNAKKRAASFITMNLPGHISPMAVYQVFSNFGEVGLVYYGTHSFNNKIRNGKRHNIMFPSGGDPEILPKKITFIDNMSRDVLHEGQVFHNSLCKFCL